MNKYLTPILITLAATSPLHAVTLISDNFNNLASGSGVNGRTPDISLAGGAWSTNSTILRGDGNGGLEASYTNSRNISIDLGAGYFTTNPGVYELSFSITGHGAANAAWIGLGFTSGANDSTSLAHTANGAQPWVLLRQSGEINVYAGANTTNLLTNDPGQPTLSTTTGTPHTFTLRLDTTATNWTVQFLLDGSLADLGNTGNTTYTYADNPTDLRHVMISVGNGYTGGGGPATIDDFLLTGPAPVPEPSVPFLLILSSAPLFLRNRRNRG